MSHTPIFWKCAHNDILTSSQMIRSFCRRDSPPWYINGLVLTIGKQAFCLTHTKSYNFCLSALFFTAHPCRLTSFSFRHTSHSLAHSISFSLFFFLFRLSFRTYRSIYAKTFSGCLWMRSIQNYTHSKLPNEFFFCFDAIFSPCRSLCSFTLKCNVHITHQSCVKGTKKRQLWKQTMHKMFNENAIPPYYLHKAGNRQEKKASRNELETNDNWKKPYWCQSSEESWQ